MKLKSKVLAGLVVVSLLLAGLSTVKADGFFSNDKKTTESTEAVSEGSTDSGGGIFRTPGDCWGCGDCDPEVEDCTGKDPDAPGDDETPIGEGILILSLLSGAYALVKRNVRKKHED